MIKESYNLFGRETQLATPNQKRLSHMLPYLDDYLYAKNLRGRSILSMSFRDIDD